nr:glycosyltransferase family 2 protein [uncultured Eisenbergiella sp.]
MDITFVIIAYNQEKRIVEALESIKFQVLHYLMGKKAQLIISDDCSEDNTVLYIKKWLAENQTIFAQVDVLISEVNNGTCRNVGKAYRLIQAERFVSFAADDLLADIDILTTLCKYDQDKLVACIPYAFSETKIVLDKKRYIDWMTGYFYTSEQILECSRRDSALINGGFYSSKLLSNEILVFMENFKFLDDQARYFYMLLHNKDIKFDFCCDSILMYRLSDAQVTNRKGRYWKRLIKDKKKLIKYTIKEEPKLQNKFSIVFSLVAMRFPLVYDLLFAPFDVTIHKVNDVQLRNSPIIEEMINAKMNYEIIKEKEKYLQVIRDKAEQFMLKEGLENIKV